MLSKKGEIQRNSSCVDYSSEHVKIISCHGQGGNQEWVYGPVSSLNAALTLFHLYT